MGRRFLISELPLADRRRVDEWIAAGIRGASIHRRLKIMGVTASYQAVQRYIKSRKSDLDLATLQELDSVAFRTALDAAIQSLKSHLLALENIDNMLVQSMAASPRKDG